MLLILTLAKYIQPLEGGPIPVKIHVISKDQEQKVKAFDTCIDVIKASGVRAEELYVFVFPKLIIS